jgi:hypothetical protein
MTSLGRSASAILLLWLADEHAYTDSAIREAVRFLKLNIPFADHGTLDSRPQDLIDPGTYYVWLARSARSAHAVKVFPSKRHLKSELDDSHGPA